MKLSVSSVIKYSVILFTIWILTLGLFGLGFDTESKMAGVNCPLAPGHSVALCMNNPTEHIQEWQNMFIANPSLMGISILFILIILSIIAYLFAGYFISNNKTIFQKIYIPYSRVKPIFNFLQEAFSNGILNPKVF